MSIFETNHKSPIKRFNLPLILIFFLAALLRISLAFQEGLWVDEIFSLSMATGHSLEHPASVADPTLGDFLEPPQPQSPSIFQQYMQHETPPAGTALVIRAVSLSDTSPPLYYLLLNLWTRFTGTSDAALRLFSALCALACLPLLWKLGEAIGGNRMAWATCLLFTFTPIALYYSGEGRMYSLIWLFGVSLAWLTLQLARRGSRFFLMLTWTLIAAGGLLTHYFFAFVCAACSIWLWLHSEKLPRTYLTGMCALAILIILPWYVQIPESLSRWRVTAGWLNYELSWKQALAAPFHMVKGLLSGNGAWGWGGPGYANYLPLGLITFLLVLSLRKCPRDLFIGHPQLLWLWLLAGIIGPILFDLVMKTQTSSFVRYALPGLPAAVLLAGFFLSRISFKSQVVFLLFILLAWMPGIKKMYEMPSRKWEPFPEVAASLKAWAKPSDTVIVHSIPSGVLGVARYLNQHPRLASWVVQLKQRQMPQAINDLISGKCRVALVKVHDMGEPSPAEAWLRQKARLKREEKLHPFTRILYFRMDQFEKSGPNKGCE